MSIIKLNKPITMSSLDIAKLTNKRHDHVLRDIRNMFNNLDNAPRFGEVEYIDIKCEKRPMYLLDEAETLCLVTKYNDKIRMAIIRQWQAMREALDTLRYRKNDTQAQIEAMAAIGHMLSPEEAKEKLPFIKANSTVNKITSDIHGFPKMLKKDAMSFPMLETRTTLLNEYAKLFEMGFSNHLINEMLRKKQKLLS